MGAGSRHRRRRWLEPRGSGYPDRARPGGDAERAICRAPCITTGQAARSDSIRYARTTWSMKGSDRSRRPSTGILSTISFPRVISF